MAIIEPTPLEPPPGEPDSGGTITQLRNNLTNNYNTIIQTPADIVKGVQHLAGTIGSWFSDPSGPAPSAPPVITPDQTAWVPGPDQPIPYTGPGPSPSWADVFAWWVTTAHEQTPDLNSVQPTVGIQVQHAIDVSHGQMLKALSGIVNHIVDLQTLSTAELANRITDVENIITALNNNQTLTNQQVHAILNLVVTGALPELWAEIAKTQAEIINEARGLLTLLQTWATDTIFKPLEENIARERDLRIAQVDGLETRLPGIIHEVVNGMGLASAASVAGIAAQVATLAQESVDCTVPMCETMGPKTDLGKLLKALAAAGDLALLAELGTMTEADLVNLITTVAGKLASFVGDLDSLFVQGGESVASFITNEIAKYV